MCKHGAMAHALKSQSSFLPHSVTLQFPIFRQTASPSCNHDTSLLQDIMDLHFLHRTESFRPAPDTISHWSPKFSRGSIWLSIKTNPIINVKHCTLAPYKNPIISSQDIHPCIISGWLHSYTLILCYTFIYSLITIQSPLATNLFWDHATSPRNKRSLHSPCPLD